MPKTYEQLTRGLRRNGAQPLIAPSLLASDFAELKREMRKVVKARCYWLHLDVMDGHFVPNISFGPPVVEALRKANSSLYFDCHLMIENPDKYWKLFIQAGAQMITIHQEACENLPAALRAIRRLGANPGVSIRPKTPLAAIEEALPLVDLVLIMTVEPGFGGQALIPRTLNKVRDLKLLKAKRPDLNYLIQVDGGIDLDTAPLAVAAGAEVLVAGTTVFRLNNGDVRRNVETLKSRIAH